MAITLSASSLAKLDHVHPDLVKVVKKLAEISDIDFMVMEGTRSVAQQKLNVAKGVSTTMNSRHIPGKDGFAHAVDLVPIVGGKVSWDWAIYNKFAPIVKKAAQLVGVPVEWGGDWKTFKDGPHFQLPFKQYP
ncbi:M15 family metallopeptidase [Rhizobium rhizogenes]|uniref:M15 family metallopeptidase n=1 Tax=Rhizobium rhizogenes TaxID=359 RepID=UPI0015741D27|nr:M15 family metallopeptidase [Rhizobium rhizogenes]NTH18448.1 M15 family metallopeptidase [Rhizobium rhizogenes]NTH31421.1 M15 family metallopeptidase [Rhizobium rhizogenes]